jgi:SAM-dependent methyltransferase
VNGFADHFSQIADRYRAARPRYPRALAEWLAATAPARTLAWEAGCGSGQFTALLAEQFERVRATDASTEQLARAAPHARVEYSVARAERSGLPDASVDLVCAAQAAHWFDLPSFYAEARRVARPRALLAVFCYGRCAIAPEVDAAVAAYHDGAAGPHWPAERAHVEVGYRDLDFPCAELPAPAFAIEASWNASQFLDYAATWSATQRQRASEGPEAFAEFAARLARAWGDAGALRRVRWPIGLRVARLA